MTDSDLISSLNQPREWAQNYAQQDAPWDTGRPCPELLRVLEKHTIAPCRAVDLGCGTGTNAVELARSGFQMTGIDGVAMAIDRAKQQADSAGVEVRFIEDNLLSPSQDYPTFDFIVDRGCYHEVRLIDLTAYLRTLRQLTHPGSLYFLLAGNADEPMEGGPPVVTRDQLQTEFSELFDLQSLTACRVDTTRSLHSPLFWSCLLVRKGETPS